jgi:hypothetical protein
VLIGNEINLLPETRFFTCANGKIPVNSPVSEFSIPIGKILYPSEEETDLSQPEV